MRIIAKILNRLWSSEQKILLTESPITILYNEKLEIDKNVSLIEIKKFNDFISFLPDEISTKRRLLYNQRFINGDYVYLLSSFDKYVSYLFVSKNYADFYQVGLRIELPHGTVAIYDVNTFESFRGCGFYKVLLSQVLVDLKKQGYFKFWLWVMPHNKLSINVHLKLNINDVIMILRERYIFAIPMRSRKTVKMHLSDFL